MKSNINNITFIIIIIIIINIIIIIINTFQCNIIIICKKLNYV